MVTTPERAASAPRPPAGGRALPETVHGKMADAIEGVERKAMEGVEKLRGK
jgi:hypothetical protein